MDERGDVREDVRRGEAKKADEWREVERGDGERLLDDRERKR